ncbi:hypothetical protein N4G41_00195 [Kosakonia sacchari]|uniref:hypothetical protein n=1 Tax=Kosakonia sacchari TaxID=1158459 RepID=UPI002ACED284|nr:hypothetical protein [Kosakonia sacchari]MDZ7320058.1 hypothetical protein [Kosakonia sacchari]
MANKYDVTITPQVRAWCYHWQNIPVTINVVAIRSADNFPADNVIVKMAVNSPDFTVEWRGEGEDGDEFETDVQGRATITGYITPNDPSITGNKTVSLMAMLKNDEGENEVHSRNLILSPASLTAPYYPLADDGLIDEGDVAARVYARISVPNSEPGDTVGLYFDEFRTVKSITTNNERLAVEIVEPLLTTGIHHSAYYAMDWASNISFSHVQDLIVERDNASGVITDLPLANVPLAQKGVINMYDAEEGVSVILDGLYNGAPVYEAAVVGSIYTVYWKSFRLDGTPVTQATRTFRAEIQDEVVPTIDDEFNNEWNAIRDLLYALGEGYVTVTYEMTLAADNQLHSSKPKTFSVDVVPPGRRSPEDSATAN